MEEYFGLLQRSPLFESVDTEGMRHILHCLEAYVSTVGKGEIINHYGDRIVWAGIVLEGKVALIAPGSDGEESSVRLAVLRNPLAAPIPVCRISRLRSQWWREKGRRSCS